MPYLDHIDRSKFTNHLDDDEEDEDLDQIENSYAKKNHQTFQFLCNKYVPNERERSHFDEIETICDRENLTSFESFSNRYLSFLISKSNNNNVRLSSTSTSTSPFTSSSPSSSSSTTRLVQDSKTKLIDRKKISKKFFPISTTITMILSNMILFITICFAINSLQSQVPVAFGRVLINNHKPGATMLNKYMAYSNNKSQLSPDNRSESSPSLSPIPSFSSLVKNSINHNNIPIDLLASLLRPGNFTVIILMSS